MVDIKSFIERLGMRKADLCRALGMDPQSSLMSSYEKGRSDPSYDKCEKLIRLGITAQELFGEELGKILLENSLPLVAPKAVPTAFLESPEFMEGIRYQLAEGIKENGLVKEEQVKYVVRQELEKLLPELKKADKI